MNWSPLRGEVSFQVPTPVTFRLQGIWPTGELINVDPLQLLFEQLARGLQVAVRRELRRERVHDVGGDVVRPVRLHERGEVRRDHRRVAADRHIRPQHIAGDEEERLSFWIGPPTPHDNSLRPKSGCWNAGDFCWKMFSAWKFWFV